MFIHYIYQPFFNILVGIYWLLGRISPGLEDMGIAVIIFSIVIRVILFPLTIASERSAEERRKIAEKVEELKRSLSHDPVKQKEEIKRVMRANARMVFSTTVDLTIQLIIILMLYRIFTTGFEGSDFYLLYPWMPTVSHINLMFLGKYDLSHTNATLNLIQSGMIFIVEFLVALRSPVPVPRRDVILMQAILPLGSYVIFMFLPAGKKVFIITSLAFSAVYQVIRLIQETINKILTRATPPPVMVQSTLDNGSVAPPTPPSGPPTN